jgi:hypothetical protein
VVAVGVVVETKDNGPDAVHFHTFLLGKDLVGFMVQAVVGIYTVKELLQLRMVRNLIFHSF